MSLEILFFIAAFFSLNLELCFCTCAQTKYEINGKCCPMCAPGHCVNRHCTTYAITTCVPCKDSTFTDVPNGFSSCFICAVCDTGQGLRVKTFCTRSSDAVCEPLDDYYCINWNKGSCNLTRKHRECSPGQYIKHKGSALKDTDCAECTDGTYSNGSLPVCQPHSKCEDLGLKEIKAGTHSTDAKCGRKTQSSLIARDIAFVILGVVAAEVTALAAAAVVTCLKYKHKPVLCAGSLL